MTTNDQHQVEVEPFDPKGFDVLDLYEAKRKFDEFDYILENRVLEATGRKSTDLSPWDDLSYDDYDDSLELLGVADDFFLSETDFENIKQLGFCQVFVQFKSGWDIHHHDSNKEGYIRGLTSKFRIEFAKELTEKYEQFKRDTNLQPAEYFGEVPLIIAGLYLGRLKPLDNYDECWQVTSFKKEKPERYEQMVNDIHTVLKSIEDGNSKAVSHPNENR